MIKEKVNHIIKSIKQYDQADIREDLNLVENFGFNSMDVMNLILELETQFNISFSDEHLNLESFCTPGNIMETLEKYNVRSS
ncbi:MAG: acyl carrier protein [Candidatus Aminicenantes bacterium]|jgi:acyl carrier protein